MSWWIWVILGFILLLAEMGTTGFFFVFFGVAAILVGALAGIGVLDSASWQWLLFSVVSVVSTLMFRPKLVQRFRPHSTPDDIDDLVGQEAVAKEDIQPGGSGQVEMRGATWSARNLDSAVLSSGQRCRVERVVGLALEVRAGSGPR